MRHSDNNDNEKEMKQADPENTQLRGTFISVMILGGFILGCWLFIYILFMLRNGG